jgi:hypothetical protein
MLARREFLASAVGFATGASLLESCSEKSRDRYDDVVAQTWRHTALSGQLESHASLRTRPVPVRAIPYVRNDGFVQ